MSRLEFLMNMRSCLDKGGLPKNEMDEALRYYEEIFLDAGPEKEDETAAGLGDPEDIAREILIENGLHPDGTPEFQMEDVKNPAQGSQNDQQYDKRYNYNYSENNGQKQRNDNLLKLVLILVTSPIWIPCAAALLGIMVAVAAVIFALFVALAAIGFGLTVGGIAGLFSVPPIGICLLGCGLIGLGLFGLIAVPMLKICFRAAASIINGIVTVIRKIFRIGEAKANG
ncbi:MAG: hypothetical protein J5994_03600 [Ruminococcus sp.]|nr:hypothetical protein [Ruminococcus sp.]